MQNSMVLNHTNNNNNIIHKIDIIVQTFKILNKLKKAYYG